MSSNHDIPNSDTDAWNLAEGTLNGSPVLLRYRPKLAEFLGDPRFPRLLTIDWAYDTNDSGLPSDEQSDQMRAFEDALESSPDFIAHAILTFVRTHDGTRRWHYYIDDVRQTGEALNSALQHCPVMPIQLAVEDDPAWDEFNAILNHCRDD